MNPLPYVRRSRPNEDVFEAARRVEQKARREARIEFRIKQGLELPTQIGAYDVAVIGRITGRSRG